LSPIAHENLSYKPTTLGRGPQQPRIKQSIQNPLKEVSRYKDFEFPRVIYLMSWISHISSISMREQHFQLRTKIYPNVHINVGKLVSKRLRKIIPNATFSNFDWKRPKL